MVRSNAEGGLNWRVKPSVAGTRGQVVGDQSVIYWHPPNLRTPQEEHLPTNKAPISPSTSTWNTNDIECQERKEGETSQVRCCLFTLALAVVTLALCNPTMPPLPMMPHADSHRVIALFHTFLPSPPSFPPTLIHSRVCREADGRLKASFVQLAGVAIFWLGGARTGGC